MNYYVWVGPREVDCICDTLFSDTICYYSNKNTTPIRLANIYGNTFNQFICEKMMEVLNDHPDTKFIFYNPLIAYQLPASLREHVECLNEKALLDMLSDKIYTRYWLGRYVPVLPSVLIDSANLSFEELATELGSAEQYIVQRNKTSGGLGTYILTKENEMFGKLKKEFQELFIVSPYIYNGFSLNINAIIERENTILFPPSLQLSQRNKERLIYQGADYIAIQKIRPEALEKIKQYAQIILERVKSFGYLGIIGIDFLVTEDEVYYLEINPRYQASSFLLNIALKDKGYSSLSELNLAAFNGKPNTCFNFEQLEVNYSFYKYLYTVDAKHLYHVAQNAATCTYIEQIAHDGWNDRMPAESEAYCYSVIFHTNIASLNFDYRYDLYSNIDGEETYIKKNLESDIGLKIALINQGCVIMPDAQAYLQSNGLVKKAVFSAIDFRLSNGLPINAPVNLKFNELSPFNIRYNGKLLLYYYDQNLSEITIEMQPSWSNKQTQNGTAYTRIAYLSTDRLRLKHESVCIFKKTGKGCYFCNVPEMPASFETTDFEEVLDDLLVVPSFRHILIGGGSGEPQKEAEQIIAVTQMIRRRNPKIPIYLMSIPPQDASILKAYKDAGISEIAFNIEIWDRKCASAIMPGKGSISLEHYLDMLKEGTKFWGKEGNVRTALIVGLNQTKSLLAATEYLCQNGIQPMFSIFRPMPGTKLESIVPPSNQLLLDIYRKVTEICARYHLEPGPACKECRNNMLAL